MPRLKLSALASMETRDNDQAFCAVADVSQDGIGLKTAQPPTIGQSVLLRLAIEEEIHTFRATVQRVEQRAQHVYDVGLHWSKWSAKGRKFLDRYLAAQALQT